MTEPRIAIVGAGIMGVTAAIFLRWLGVHVEIFEKTNTIGGVWRHHANRDSCLQIDAKYFPLNYDTKFSVRPGLPGVCRDDILREIDRLVKKENLLEIIRFDQEIKGVTRLDNDRWQLDNHGCFDGLLVATGLLQKPYIPSWQASDRESVPVVHASKLDAISLRNKRIVIVGAGAFAMEALRIAHAHQASQITLLAKQWRWVSPSKFRLGVLSVQADSLALYAPYTAKGGNEVLEYMLRRVYKNHALEPLLPKSRFYSTQVAFSDAFFDLAHLPHIHYSTGEIDQLGKGELMLKSGTVVPCDLVIAATGFESPEYSYLPDDIRPQTSNDALLYLWTILPKAPSMGILGLFSGAGTHGFPSAACQAALVLWMIKHPNKRPSEQEMNQWIKQRQGEFRPDVFQNIPNVFEWLRAYSATAMKLILK